MNKLAKTISIIALTSVITTGLITNANACTRVFMNNSNYMVSGRNLDFFGPVDPSLVITPQGVQHNGGDVAGVDKWTVKYGSVVIYADGVFPMDGMNEKGLAGHTLYYDNGSQIQADNQNKPLLQSRAWLSYILDNFATVDEAVKSIKNDVRLAAAQLPIDYASDTKHIAIEDITGDSAIIEIDHGKVMIYHNKDYRVMTNPPTYAEHLKNIEKYKNATRNEIPKDYTASDRLVRANYDLKNLPKPDNKAQAQGFVLAVLNDVAYPIGIPAGPDEQEVTDMYQKFSKRPNDNKGIGTYWSTIADLSHGEYRFKSVFAPSSVWVSLKEINFHKGQPIKVIKHLNDYGKKGWEGNILTKAVVE